MGTLTTTPKLQGDYGELIFEHFCIKNNYAYITLEAIYNTLTPKNILVFRHGYERICVKLPEDIVEEVRRICVPSNGHEEEPSFVYDYFTVSLNNSFKRIKGGYAQHSFLSRKAFHWIEVKTGKSQLTKNQKETIKKITLPLRVFRIETIMPDKINLDWESV